MTRQLGAGSGQTEQQVIRDFRTNRYDEATKTLTYTREQAVAFDENVAYHSGFFGAPDTSKGLRPNAITDREQVRQMTAFFSWTAWAASTHRPGKDYSYTTTGRRSLWSATAPPPMSWCGVCCR